MAAGKGEETALGTARGRFIESLPRKAIELRGAIALLTATPAAEGPREDMRRRLHTLYASALVFRNDALASAVKEGIERLDAARDGARALQATDLEVLTRLVKRIPELRGDDGEGRASPSSAPSASHIASVSPRMSVPTGATRSTAPSAREPRTLTGLSPVLVPAPDAAPVPAPAATATVGSSENELPAVLAVSSTPPSATQAPKASIPAVLAVESSAPVQAAPAVPSAAAAATPVESASALASQSVAPGFALLESRAVLQRVLHVLVLPSESERAQLERVLQSDSLALSFVSSVSEAVESAKDNAPDAVLADAALATAGGLVSALRADPLTDFVPVVLLETQGTPLPAQGARDLGADDRISRPFYPDLMLRVLGRATGTLVEGGALRVLGDATLDEVAQRVAEEVRRGIVDAAETGRDMRIPMGEGAEVLAAAWAAVARVRAFVSEQSAGKVRFSDRSNGTRPLLLTLGPSQGEAAAETTSDSVCKGRRFLVVDDDAAVVEFFAGVLRDHGATVLDVRDGREALEAARRERPDVVISDIMMPGLDGFALCRELKRDPALADVPVVLTSWKDELLQRMRELASGASGYLRKQAGTFQVLSCLREVLEPRISLEAKLKERGDVRGNLEGTGVVALLRSVRRARPNAKVTLRDAWNLFECELREGELAQLTRTASDGSFVRGERALPHLLGASAGRFTVSAAEGALKSHFEGSLDEVLRRGARELGAQLDALSGPLLGRAARVVFDEDAYGPLVSQAPAPVRAVIERLHAGEAPSKLLKRAELQPAALEAILLDMTRRGAIRGVVGSGGEDLVAEARTQRAREAPIELSSPRSIIPPAPNPVISVLRPPPGEQVPSVLEPATMSSLEVLEAPPASLVAEPQAPSQDHEEELPTGQFDPLSRGEAERVLQHASEQPAAAAAPDSQSLYDSDPELARSAPAQEPAAQPVEALASVTAEALLPEPPRAIPVEELLSAQRKLESTEPDSAAVEERSRRSTLAGWVVALLVLFAIGHFAGRSFESPRQADVEAIGSDRPSRVAAEPAREPQPSAPALTTAQPAPSSAASTSERAAVGRRDDSGFEIFDRIIDPSVPVAPDQGLVMIDATPRLVGSELSIDEQRIGALPAKVPLSEGIHELAIARGDTVQFRFVSVHRGKTWVLREP